MRFLRKYGNIWGVRYVYEEEREAEEKASPSGMDKAEVTETRASEDIAMIPAELVATLEEAVEIADMEMMSEVIAQIRGYDVSLAEALAQLMNNFEYDGILALLQKTERR